MTFWHGCKPFQYKSNTGISRYHLQRGGCWTRSASTLKSSTCQRLRWFSVAGLWLALQRVCSGFRSKKVGRTNFVIYGHCLAHAQKSGPRGPIPAKPSQSSPFQHSAKRKWDKELEVCYRWNDNAHCDRVNCQFWHVYIYCKGNYHELEYCRKPKQ